VVSDRYYHTPFSRLGQFAFLTMMEERVCLPMTSPTDQVVKLLEFWRISEKWHPCDLSVHLFLVVFGAL
jgi:hypothetical protein